MKKIIPQMTERFNPSWSKESKRLFHTPSAFARKNLFYVQEAGFFETHAPYFTARENLESFLLLYTTKGHGILHYLGKTYTLMPDTLFFIDCRKPHHYECPSHVNWSFYWIHFDGIAAQGYFEQIHKNGFELLQLKEDDKLTIPFQSIISLLEQKPVGFEVSISKNLTDILTKSLLISYQSSLEDSHFFGVSVEITKFLEQNYNRTVSLDEIAAYFHVSKYHLSREFKKNTGTSPYEYLLICRINHAKEYLRYTTMSVEEIAEKCGFGQSSHFISIFKTHEKTTPLSYRKQWS